MIIIALIVLFVLFLILTTAIVSVISWVHSIKKRLDALELALVRGIMEEKPENIKQVLETMKTILRI